MEDGIRSLFGRAKIPGRIVSVERLEGGYSNTCFGVATDLGRRYKVRFGGNNDVIDRRNERRVLENVGVGWIHYEDNGDGIWEWTDGEALSGRGVDAEIIGKVIGVMEEIHGCSGEGVMEHDDLEHLEGCVDMDAEDRRIYLELVGRYGGDRRCLCHNDISLSNLIYDSGTGRLRPIDYEWARVNHPYWDYGNFVREADLDWGMIGILAEGAGLEYRKLVEFALVAAYYSLQLSRAFRDQTPGLEEHRRRLRVQIGRYRRWLWGG